MATKPQLIRDKFQTLLEKDALVPLGSNGLSALAMFEEREYYKVAIYPSEFEAPVPFDLWYKRPLFGKIDPKGNPMFPLKSHMKQLVSDNSNVWVMDFVADAFRDFQAEFLFVNERDVAGTPFEFLNPRRGWSSAIVDYDRYMDSVYSRFKDYIILNGKDSEIVTFDKFMDLFYDFVNTQTPRLPITFSQYIVSPFCSPTISGLMFDISSDIHGNDVDKYNHFINNRNFICYAQTAQKFGFKVDKNFPGRLIADINSPVMNRSGDPKTPPSQGGQGYMRKYPKKPEKFRRKQPREPQRRIIPQPTSYPTNPFEDGDEISLLISHKLGVNASAPTKWLILSDFSELEQRNKEAGATQKHKSQNGAIKKGLETLKIKLHSLGYSAPQRIMGKIFTQQSPMGYGLTSQIECEETVPPKCETVFYLVRGPNTPPEAPMIADFPNETFRQNGSQPPKLGDTIDAVTFENVLNNESNDGFSYGLSKTYISYPNLARPVRGVRMEIPMNAAHLSPHSLPFQQQRFIRRTSYPAKLQKWRDDSDEAERLYLIEWNEWDNETMPNYTKAKTTNNEVWSYYRNPLNQLTVNNVFNKRYRKSYLEDMYILKEICMQFYYSYTNDNPVATVTKLVRSNGDTFLTKVKVIEREQISKNLIKQKYPEPYWIKQYMLIRNAELEIKKTFDQIRIIRRRALDIYEKEGLSKTLKYIKEKMPANAYDSVMDLRS